MLPRVVARPDQLKRRIDGLVERDGAGVPLDLNGRPAARLSFRASKTYRAFTYWHIEAATLQQMDNALRHDV